MPSRCAASSPGWRSAASRELGAIRTHHVSAYVEMLTRTLQGADGQAAPRGDPHAVRLADRRPGRRPEPGRRGARPEARRQERQDAGARRRRGANSCSTASTSSTVVGLRDRALIALLIYTLRPDLGRAAHERRGLLPAGQALVGAAARERRQAARDARAPSAGDLYRRLRHRRRHRRGEDRSPVPHARRPRPQAARR